MSYHGMNTTTIEYQERIDSLVEELAHKLTKEVSQEYENKWAKENTPLHTHVERAYRERMMSLLNDDKIPLYLREHYAESPTFYGNQSHTEMVDTLVWLSYSNEEKKSLLDSQMM